MVTASIHPTFDYLDVESIQRQILDWYAVHRRDLPWRGDRDPYHILASEIMLQQTQVERVIPKYLGFLDRFPTLHSLNAASPADVLRAWSGLGFNRRALNLKRTADVVFHDLGGRIPRDVNDLERLPGIGRYTARAVASFAFDVQVAVVDTNVRRVLLVLADRDLNAREVESLAEHLLAEGQASEWNQALMDYGALVYRAKPTRSGRQIEPFGSTNRFWRGRIIDTLRRYDVLSVPVLLENLPPKGRDGHRVRSLLRTLREEGLVEYDSEDVVSLPH